MNSWLSSLETIFHSRFFFLAVTMSSIAKVIIALTLIAVLSIDITESKCCDVAYVSHHVCLGIPTEKHLPIHLIYDFPIDKNFPYWMRRIETDEKRPKCISYFCEDGSDATKYTCGIGKCNIFGCNCKDGCRKSNGSSHQEMGRMWREKHGLLVKGKHHLKGTFE